jgi:uncharacterized protein (DUF934 family)
MPQLIRDRALAADAWTLLRTAASLAELPENGSVIVPLALWTQQREALSGRGHVGVLLAPTDDPATLADDIAALPLIAVDFPQFTDGRGYSTARLLREKYAFRGELRAVGDVLRDQLRCLAASGFDAFALRGDRDAQEALKHLDDFSDSYQSTVPQPVPYFSRRDAFATPTREAKTA